uniref:ATP synthase F1 subunit 8 n=1 Tax=Myripristis kuntee TaxID=88698 RepID=UPI002E774470|nr:ATP synthase F1 subunit 8 [Myripristis kuntee]YP_011003591.1 ATP synthase F1 subunit 8 [Myripristis violacea]WPS65954.1 ATP synthase F1 subunit 8 [Myripristis kuntee]WPS65980.1 ATP synthase F1 subunit 8 [Myripristis violacea]
MPQLDPAPWFMTLVFSWAVFLVVIPPKVTAHVFPNEPSTRTTETLEHKPWHWPWH